MHEFPIFYSCTVCQCLNRLNGICSDRVPILFCGDVPSIKQLNYKQKLELDRGIDRFKSGCVV